MGYELSFTALHQYNAGMPGIDLAIVLHANQKRTGFFAKLDTGASHCIFERIYGDELLLNIENGYELKISTATGVFTAYGHDVTLSVGDFDFAVMVYFAKDSASLALHVDNRLLVYGEIQAIDGIKNPGEFDYQNYLHNQSIDFQISHQLITTCHFKNAS